MIIFISCVKLKQNKKCKAEDLYISSLFKKSLAYAKKLKPNKIFILSAKYGVLELKDMVEPYEVTLNKLSKQEKKKWAYSCLMQLKNKNVDFNEQCIFLCGKNYREYLMKVFKNSKAPLQNLGIGKQLKFYKDNL